MKAILMPIHPEYVERILNGTKRFEYRKQVAKTPCSTMLIYATAPVQKVVAQARVTSIKHSSVKAIWNATKHRAGISQHEYNKYFMGCSVAYAYELDEIKAFVPARDLADYGIDYVPQSFVYVDIEEDKEKER